MIRPAAALFGLIVSIAAVAHHGANTNPELYLAENLVELDGEISRVLWRNPHPRLMIEVVDDQGNTTEWELEMSGGLQSWQRDGVDRDFFKVGERVKAAGVVSRRTATSIGVVNILLPNGKEVASRNRPLRWSNERLVAGMGSAMGGNRAAVAGAPPEGLFRIWGRRTSGRPPAAQYAASLSETGRETLAKYYAPRDNPDYHCLTGMPHNMFDPLPIEITDGGDWIQIESLEYNVKRTIYLSENRPAPSRSNVGYSVGRWEGGSLIVETDHVDWPFFDPFGTPQSDQVSFVETFRVADGNSRLDYNIVATDPVMFSEPVRLERAWLWQPEVEMYQYDCVPEWGDETND